jgi:ribosomal protein S18 acetylase RimI-like enzyme
MRGDADRQDTSQTHRTEWRVRPAGPSDRAFMLGITPRLAQGFDLPSWRSAREVVAAESATLDAALRPGADQGAVLLAEEGGGVPGGYAYVRAETDYYGRTHAHIEILAVSQTAEGRGAGRALVLAAEGWARAAGLDLITLNVFADNRRARALYERLGFAPETLHYAKPLT